MGPKRTLRPPGTEEEGPDGHSAANHLSAAWVDGGRSACSSEDIILQPAFETAAKGRRAELVACIAGPSQLAGVGTYALEYISRLRSRGGLPEWREHGWNQPVVTCAVLLLPPPLDGRDVRIARSP